MSTTRKILTPSPDEFLQPNWADQYFFILFGVKTFKDSDSFLQDLKNVLKAESQNLAFFSTYVTRDESNQISVSAVLFNRKQESSLFMSLMNLCSRTESHVFHLTYWTGDSLQQFDLHQHLPEFDTPETQKN